SPGRSCPLERSAVADVLLPIHRVDKRRLCLRRGKRDVLIRRPARRRLRPNAGIQRLVSWKRRNLVGGCLQSSAVQQVGCTGRSADIELVAEPAGGSGPLERSAVADVLLPI